MINGFFYIFQTYEKPRDYISKNVDLNHLPYFSLGSYRKWNRQKKTFNLLVAFTLRCWTLATIAWTFTFALTPGGKNVLTINSLLNCNATSYVLKKEQMKKIFFSLFIA